MVQVKTPNLDPVIYQGGVALNDWSGWCLAYVQTAFGTGWSGSTAWDCWANRLTKKHADRNLPAGVYIPIFFSGYYGMGHTAIYKDGKVWSSPLTHKPYADVFNSVGEVERSFGVTYVGWSEDLGGSLLVESSADVLTPNQRKVGPDGANYRTEPDSNSTLITEFDAGEILNFKGYVKGQDPYGNGNNIWFVGAYSGGFVYSGATTDPSTNGLSDITPTAPPAQPNTKDKVIDVSAHNAITDYATVISNVRGAIAKAGHTGKSYGGTPLNGDPKFNDYKTNFGTKLNGAYWYAYCSLDPITEASNFVKAVGISSPEFTYWLDIEETNEQTKEQVNAWCVKFLEEVDKQTNKVCGIYMNRNWFDNYITAETKGSRPIWLAHYDTPEFSNPVPNQVAHQYTSSGKVVGYAGNLDLNAVNDKFFTPTPIAPVTPPVGPPVVDPPVVVPPQPPKPEEKPENGSQTLLEVIQQLIKKITLWLSGWKRNK